MTLNIVGCLMTLTDYVPIKIFCINKVSNCDPLKTVKTDSSIIEKFQLLEKQKLMENRTELVENIILSFLGSSLIVESD